MHEAALAIAALPAPVSILGIPLKPYSLGHELFLLREQNAFLTNPDKWKWKDLFEVAWICSQSFEENKRGGGRWDCFKLALWRLIKAGRISKSEADFNAQKVKDYISSGSLAFRKSDTLRPGRQSGRLPGAPFLLRLCQFLISKLGKTESEAWNYPLGLAQMHWQTYWESEGQLDLYNEHDSDFDAYVAAEELKAAMEGGEKCQAC